MAFLSGKNNNFKFAFPKVFVPEEIEKKYSPILNRIPGNMEHRRDDITVQTSSQTSCGTRR